MRWIVRPCVLLLLAACRPSEGPADDTTCRGTDCDDVENACTPEVCNGLDDDCDDVVDDDASDVRTWYVDQDGDGHGTTDTVLACERPEGAANQPGDCDDADPGVFPGAREVCGDGRVTDCAGAACRWDGHVSLAAAAALRVAMDEPQSVALSSAAGVGDVDGDGLDDVLFGADHHTFATEFDGGAFLYRGGTAANPASIGLANAWVTGPGPGYTSVIGTRVAGAGDVDGDGHADILVHAYGSGPAWLLYGPIAPGTPLLEMGIELPTATMAQEVTSLTRSQQNAAGVGDLNEDGFDDLVHADSYRSESGVYVQLGPVSPGLSRDQAYVTWIGGPDAGFGLSVDRVGDLTGDGLAEVAASALNTDPALEWPGGVFVSSLPAPGRYSWTDMDAILLGYADYQAAGLDFAGGSDVDGDGYNDLLVGANTQYGLEGELLQPVAAWLVSGPIDADSSLEGAEAQVTVIWGAEARRGAGTALPGDMDGDGFGEVAVGLVKAARSADVGGGVALFYGPFSGQHTYEAADAMLWGEFDWAQVGGPGRLDAAGDFDGDGFPDLVTSAVNTPPADGQLYGVGWVLLGQSL